MKKTYICPQIEEIQLKANQTLLAGSITDDGNGGYSGGPMGDYNETTDEVI